MTPEFELTAECCRWAFSGRDATKVHALCRMVDWPRFQRTALFHRVHGLAWNCLYSIGADVPPAVARSLSGESRQIAASNLRIAVEAGELRAALECAEMRPLFVKGLALATLAYPKPMLKAGWDIDLLVDADELSAAAAELDARGYQRIVPPPSTDLAKWHAHRKESVWAKADQRLYVELHSRLTENRDLIPTIGIDSPRQEVEILRGVSLSTLGRDELFAYLCVHGASSLWFRLKWITDLAAVLHPAKPTEIERLYCRSQKLGAGRAAAQALLLADAIYGTLGDASDLREQLLRDPASRWLLSQALEQLAGRPDPVEPTSRPLGTLRMHLTQLALLPGLRFKAREFARQARAALG